ncbi:MAG: Gfo/Idh/MocA family oxidoreductase [Litorimonas sp.]
MHPDTSKVDLAIAGYGAWGRKLVHSVRDTSDRVRFSTMITRDPDARVAEAAEAGMRCIGSLGEVLEEGTVDGIVLATPHSRHADEVTLCGRAGMPVFVEKPFALCHSDAVRALDACPDGLVVAAGHNRRFLPAVIELGSMVAAGDLGRILCAEGNFSGNVVGRYAAGQWRASRSESPAGGLAGAGIHILDLVGHLVAPIISVAALSGRRALDIDMDDTTSVLLDLDGGAQAVLVSVMASAPDFRLKLFGTKASAELRGERELVIVPVNGAPTVHTFEPVDTERAELEAFADAILGGAPYPVTHDEILVGVAALEAIGQAAARRCWVNLP